MTDTPLPAPVAPAVPETTSVVDLRAAGLFVAPGQEAGFAYRNRRGTLDRRRVRPVALWYGATRWHPRDQWLLRAVDLGRGVPRDFALADITADTQTAEGRVDLRTAGLLVAPGQEAVVTYRNWRGEVAERQLRPIALWYGATDWHPHEQWLLRSIDLEKGLPRDFAVADILLAADVGA